MSLLGSRALFIGLSLCPGFILSQNENPVTPSLSRDVVNTCIYTVVDGDSLALDLRIPNRGVSAQIGVVFLHGGGFSSGQRNSGPHVRLLQTLAEAGIASASITYRLTMKGRNFGCNIPAEEKQLAVQHASDDAHRAFRWLKQSPLPLPEHWVIMGSSAGAEAAMWAGYGQEDPYFLAVVSFSGAISASHPVPESAIPFFGVHGICDDVVPAGLGLHRDCPPDEVGSWMLCGGECWSTKLAASGSPFRFRGICDGTHSVCNTGMTDPEIQKELIAWLKSGFQLESTRQFRPETSSRFQEMESCPSPCH